MTLLDRLMFALPTSRAGTIALTASAGLALLAACIRWLGWWPTVALIGGGAAGAWVWWARETWRRWL